MKHLIITLVLTLSVSSSAWSQGTISQINPTTADVRLSNGQHLFLDFYGQNIFRLFHDPKGGAIRDPEAVPPAQILVDRPRRQVSIRIEGNTVSTSRLSVQVSTSDGALRVGDLTISPAEFSRAATSVTLSQKAGENFFGGGVQNGRFIHTGNIIQIVNTNNWVDGGVSSPCPFFWSTGGYAVMPYTFSPGRYDFGASHKGKTVLTHDTDYLDMFLMFDDGMVALLNDYYQLTGNPVLLPKFGFYEGHLNAYNRDYWTETDKGVMPFEDGKFYKESQKDNGGAKESLNGEGGPYQFSARAVIDRYIDNDMPLGWILPNDGYATGYGQTGTLEGNIDNLRQFGEYAHTRGVEVGLWTQSDLHPKEGVEPLLQRDIIGEVRDGLVRVIKTDVAWVGAGYSFGLNGIADVAHVMPYYGGARPFIISVDGWAGTQRYAGIWTGDQTGGNWEYIRFHVPTYIGSGLSGQPNIGSDVDGIFGGNNMPVNVRDFQWKTFTPLQLNMDGWGLNPKYPQALGEPAASINRWYLKLKSKLMPYTYSIAHEAIDGKPIIRAMFLEEENAYTFSTRTQYQFMYGPYMLIAPIYRDGDDRDGIYLPSGLWMDYFSGEVLEGGRVINDFPAPLWKLPVFIKLGAVIPFHKATLNPSQADPHMRGYDIYPAEGNHEFTEYDDDGRTTAYLSGKSTTTLIQHSMAHGVLHLQILPARGDFDGFEKQKATIIRIACTGLPKKLTVKVKGKKVRLTAVADESALMTTPDSYFFGTSDDDYVKSPALWLHIASHDVTASDILVEAAGLRAAEVAGVAGKPVNPAVHAPEVAQGSATAYSVTPAWASVEGAEFYELMSDGMTYSTIRGNDFTIEELAPETSYALKVRAVLADGVTPWADFHMTTAADPLRFAIRGIRAVTSCKNQGGQGTDKLFDFDETTTWHTEWGAVAVPFDLTIDLHSVNSVERLLYMPREDAANGTILEGSAEYSLDKKAWTAIGDFRWARDNKTKEITLSGNPTVRYIRLHVTKAVGDFGSGRQLYVFRQPGSSFYIPGDINQDNRIDENDLTSYLNYTGLRLGDGDFEGYISQGDINKNGLIDAYDISTVATELEGGVDMSKDYGLAGAVTVTADKKQYKEGDTMTLTVTGKGLNGVNAFSMAIPYDTEELEFVSVATDNIPEMYNMTNNRLHTNGQKVLYPTFVNVGKHQLLSGDKELLRIVFRVRKDVRTIPTAKDIILVDPCMNQL